MYFLNEFKELVSGLDEKKNRKMQLDMVVRLIKKLDERFIEDDKLAKMFELLLSAASNHLDGLDSKIKTYNRQKSLITDYVLKVHRLAYKSYYTTLFTALGLVFGSVFGIFFIITNPVLYAVCIGGGIAIGVGIGVAKEKRVTDEGLIY